VHQLPAHCFLCPRLFNHAPPTPSTRYDHNATTSHRRPQQSFQPTTSTAASLHSTYILMGLRPLPRQSILSCLTPRQPTQPPITHHVDSPNLDVKTLASTSQCSPLSHPSCGVDFFFYFFFKLRCYHRCYHRSSSCRPPQRGARC